MNIIVAFPQQGQKLPEECDGYSLEWEEGIQYGDAQEGYAVGIGDSRDAKEMASLLLKILDDAGISFLEFPDIWRHK